MTYPETLLDHYRNPRRRGKLSNATHRHQARNVLCGDEVEMQFRVEDGRIMEAAWDGVGCVYCVAAASQVCTLLVGQEVDSAPTVAVVESGLDIDVPAGRKGCVELPVDAARKALS